MSNSFQWPNLAESIFDDGMEASDLIGAWCDAFAGWEFDLPGAKRLKVVRGASFYSGHSGGVQLYTYVWHEADGRGSWLAYSRGLPSEIRRYATNFRKAVDNQELKTLIEDAQSDDSTLTPYWQSRIPALLSELLSYRNEVPK